MISMRRWTIFVSIRNEIAPGHAGVSLVHHRYPFDRLLILQAKAEGSTLVSSDVALDLYAVPRIW
jgi:PIN domain nuclease of toxin-antitoxin system